MKAKVILFKASGKYYTEEEWDVPAGAIGPYDMAGSRDFRRIGGGAVLVESQEPWGYPHLFPGVQAPHPQFPCSTDGCPGDGRYAAPGRGHLVECAFPLPNGRSDWCKRVECLGLIRHAAHDDDGLGAVREAAAEENWWDDRTMPNDEGPDWERDAEGVLWQVDPRTGHRTRYDRVLGGA